ncbi:MAG TPA: metallophosphoesterase [Gammaproteobacteria bacterium]|nr:metallophosphoesterase [Gammaproteobacteria bacterium]
MIKILLISDTHGRLDIINDLIEKTKVDLVIHAGDFGFYNESSYRHISSRELRLLISHSPYGKDYRVDKQTSREMLIEIVKRHQLLGDFSAYQDGNKRFDVPIYAVYGNHEDSYVIEQLKGNNKIHHFNLLDEDNIYQIADDNEPGFKLFGIGGNFLVSNKLLDKPIAGKAGKIWSTLHQFGFLYRKLEKKSKPSIFVSHVSPGKEPLLTRLIIHFMPDIWVSGHMGAPYTCVWNEFTVRNMNESLFWLNSALEKLPTLAEEYLTPEAKLAYDVIKREIPRKDFWFKKLWYVNLPDAKNGYAILTYYDEKFFVEGRCYDLF